MALLFQSAIVGQLTVRHAIRLRWRMEVNIGDRATGGAGDQRRHTEGEATPPHIGKGDGALRPSFAGGALFLGANTIGREQEIAVQLQRVHRQVEMGVNNEHVADSCADDIPTSAGK